MSCRWAMVVCLATAGCLPDTSDFTVADLGQTRDGSTDGTDAALDGGLDMFVPQDCMTEAECRSPRNGCQDAQGRCEGGECVYDTRTGEDCDDENPCTLGDVCGATGCFGMPVTCTPPGARCEGDQRVTSSGGRCEAGDCVFDEARETCAMGCAGGVCEVDVCTPMDWTLTDIGASAPVDFSSDADFRTDGGGNDHIAYVSDDGVHHLYRPRGGSWTDDLVESTGAGMLAKDPQLGFDATGAPHIVFATWNDTVIHAERIGGAWTAAPIGDGTSPAVAGTPDGAIHVVFEESGLRHAIRASGATDWVTNPIRRTDGGFTRAAYADATRLLADGAGRLHLVFTDFAEDELSHGLFTTEWTLDTVHAALVLPSAFDATIDAGGAVHVSFSDDAGRDLYYAQRPAAGGWSSVVVHAAIERMGDPNAIAVTAAGAVHIVYRDEDRREVRYADRPAGGTFGHAPLEPTNGFAAGAYADDAGRVRLVYRAVPVGSEVLRVAEVRDCP